MIYLISWVWHNSRFAQGKVSVFDILGAKGVIFEYHLLKKSRIRETRNLLNDADSSTDTKKILLVRQTSPNKQELILHDNFTPFMRQSFKI